ncbi:hypothetical protein [Shewanella gelidii]|nr:hypothetical protein [Shewanella gelidii]
MIRNIVLAYALWLVIQDVSDYMESESVETLFAYIVEQAEA